MEAVNNKAAFFVLKEAGMHLTDNGKICTLVTSLLGAFTPFYSSYAGTNAPVGNYTRAAANELGDRGISVTAIGPGPMDTPFSILPKAPMRWRITRPQRHCRRPRLPG